MNDLSRRTLLFAGLSAAGGRQGLDGAVGIRPVRAAFQCRHVHAGLGQHASGGVGMAGLAAVAGAGQGQFGVGEAKAFGRAAGHQGQGLQHLDGGAREDGTFDVADGGVHGAIGVHHCQRAAVTTVRPEPPSACSRARTGSSTSTTNGHAGQRDRQGGED